MSTMFSIIGVILYALAFFKETDEMFTLGYLILGSIFIIGGAIIGRLK